MATRPIEPERRALPLRRSTRPGIAKRRPRRQSVPAPITILERRQYLDFVGEGGRTLLHRERIADCIEVILALLDIAERDHDLEEDIDLEAESDLGVDDEGDGVDDDTELNGDELDGNPAEDEFMYHGGSDPGCPTSDPDACHANEDRGTASSSSDGLPGNPEDAEDGGDTELNGDEGDYGGEVDGV